MRNINIDGEWTFRYALPSFYPDEKIKDEVVNLPHDYMIHSDVKKDAPAGPAMGYYTAGVASYSKNIDIPLEWEGERVFLAFDGVMQNATIEVNESKVCVHHYGYTPFQADITNYIVFGKSNKVIVTINPSMQPNSRWYTGAGIIRSVELVHTGQVHIEHDGVFVHTRKIDYSSDDKPQTAYMSIDINVCNHFSKDKLVKVEAEIKNVLDSADLRESDGFTLVQVPCGGRATAHINLRVNDPKLWSDVNPELYNVNVKITGLGDVGASIEIPNICEESVSNPKGQNGHASECEMLYDEYSTTTGIRTIFWDAANGLRINEKIIKLKGGCIHHDNGVIGAVSLYDSEYRKLTKLKKAGFNAVRIAHNPPSSVLLKVCDEIGMYVYDEAFDAWSMCKQPGDYNQFFEDHWREDIHSFVARDFNHPSVIIWSTGNEIMERGGKGRGYLLADKLASYIKELDNTRPVSNAVCSFWLNPSDDTMKNEYDKLQNICKSNDYQDVDLSWEYGTAAFVNSLDIVGYNYLDQLYNLDSKVFSERIIVGTESFPNQFDTVWNNVMERPNVIGDFTWTCVDYIGEAGIGRAAYVDEGDPLIEKGPWGLMSDTAQYPWRLANDADFDIIGNMLPQGAYRSIVWGSNETFLYSYSPENYGRHEIVSGWGWPYVSRCWNWKGYEGEKTDVVVYSNANEVELICNGKSIGRKPCGKSNKYTAVFTLCYEPGELEAISYDSDGSELSRARLVTAGSIAGIRLICGEESEDATKLTADGHNLCYVMVEIVDSNGFVVPDAEIKLNAIIDDSESDCSLAGFGSAAPKTEENYQAGSFTSYRGRALAVIRAGYKTGFATFKVSSSEYSELCAEVHLEIEDVK